MEDIFEFIDEVSKRLNRPVKDLDDIRLVMLSLKEVRENEIRIDMEIGPIEVSYLFLLLLFYFCIKIKHSPSLNLRSCFCTTKIKSLL